MMRIYFKDASSINNLSDLKKLGSTWYDIGRGIAMTQDKSPEDFVVVGAQKGSIILELAVAARIATSVSKILLETLKVAEKVIDILKKVEELKANTGEGKISKAIAKILKDKQNESNN
mgnify:CR=1 FL=1